MGLDRRKSSDFTRRAMLAGAGAGLLAIAAGIDRTGKPKQAEEPKQKETPPEDALNFLKVGYKPRRVTLGRIADRTVERKINGKMVKTPVRLRGDAEMMTGLTTLEKEVTIDPHHQLSVLWRSKMETDMRKADGTYNPTDIATAKKLFESYNPEDPKPTTLENYRRSIQASLNGVRANLDLNKLTTLEQFSELSHEQLALIKDLEKEITQDTMLAYVLTELMPMTGSDAILGAELLDEILRHYGRDYIGLYPARHDKSRSFSFGDYQSTKWQVREAYKRNHKTGAREEDFTGASVINKLVTSGKIPADFLDLRGDQHHVAAYLFAVYNIAYGVRELGKEGAARLRAARKHIPTSFVEEYVAASHHRISDAIGVLKLFTDAMDAYSQATPDARLQMKSPDFAESAKKRDSRNAEINKKRGKKIKPVDMHAYVLKTRDNRRAVRKRFG